MGTIDLKEKMFSELMTEIQSGATMEIAAFQRAKTKMEEIEDLRKQYVDAAENLREKAKVKPSTGMNVENIKNRVESKNQVTRELRETEDAIKEIDENFLPGATEELSMATDQLYAYVQPTIFRHKKAWQNKIDKLCEEINGITDGWLEALLLFKHNEEFPILSIESLIIMKDFDVKGNTPFAFAMHNMPKP